MKKTFVFSFKRSLPILLGFFPLGIAYGILMQQSGYNALWTGACSTVVFAGSLQFLMVSFLTGSFSMLTIIFLSLMLNGRHIFYGLSFIERFQRFGKLRKWFLVFSLTDENYSLHCSFKPEEGIDERAAHVMTAALTYSYWVGFSILGAIVGSLIKFNTEGIDFSLTALFTVILIDQIRGAKNAYPALIALFSSIACIIIFGADNFILPSLILTMAALLFFRRRLESGEEEAKAA